jgi:dTDP-4-dehydrorhamnose reductase
MKIFITGGSGLLGSRLAEISQESGHDVISGYNHNAAKFGEPIKLDLAQDSSICRAMAKARPEVIFHTAALTDVDRCEVDNDLACRINARATKLLAKEAKKGGAFLIYVSTDYVFDGNKGMYKENDPTNPANFYGFSKLQGEQYADCVARTCVVYGSRPASGKVNFALWAINKLQDGDAIKIVTDQYVSPTLNTNLARMILEAGEQKREGIFHLAGATMISRYEFACKIADAFGLEKSLIISTKMAEMRWRAKRPGNSSLDVSRAARSFIEKPWDIDKSIKTLREEIT